MPHIPKTYNPITPIIHPNEIPMIAPSLILGILDAYDIATMGNPLSLLAIFKLN
jgi:hypothetical protein